ncbi:putative 3-hydroxyacyl-CoA dehydrogenase [Toxocara canis]|uniref:3-hydroxyacyl-CoA dehydrogenase n=2 Tax=Toxocara canis TaxID=6265 RepID=A0A0B2VZX9_TOXCA|nr:putative 3-hydroxyacyl-CoA dehydrogenase [Toxocara canis]
MSGPLSSTNSPADEEMSILHRSLAAMASVATREISTSLSARGPVKNVTVIGSGLMGSGIAQVTAQAQMNVTLVDRTDAILQKARTEIDKSVRRVAKKKFGEDIQAQEAMVDEVMKHITMTTDIPKAVSEADLVIEAVVENLSMKQKVFEQIEAASPSGTLLASNTSSLRLCDIAANLKRKSNFGGLHFFNPVPVMKLLEVVRYRDTSDETFNSLLAFGKAVGKVTVSCKDTPGFIVNRLLVPYMFEALRMVERGDASMKDIDTAMKLGAGYPMGPFELGDYVGLDTMKFIQDGWHERYPDEPLFKPSELLNKLVAEGKYGRKSGQGFYEY